SLSEREPNDTPAGANPLVLGTSVTGEICSHDNSTQGDVDFWTFTATAGSGVELDVDVADGDVVPVNARLDLFARGGVTPLVSNDDADGVDPRLQFVFRETGVYYARVSAAGWHGASPFRYTLHMRPVTPGPGDPVTVRADSLGFPFGMAVGPSGELY